MDESVRDILFCLALSILVSVFGTLIGLSIGILIYGYW